MILREIILILIACSFLSRAAAQEVPLPKVMSQTAAVSQDFSQTVIPISKFKVGIYAKRRMNLRPSLNPLSYVGVGVEDGGGTGFCVDPECRFIGTNYHVTLMGTPRKIKGEKIVQQYLATGPDDEGATLNEGPFVAKYTLRRDLAIFELRHALPKHRGIGFNLDDLRPGQEVDIYGFPKEGINPVRHLLRFDGTFQGETTRGLLLFSYSLSGGKAIRGGASGGIVVDRKTRQIVGILSQTAKNEETVVLAVPVQALIDFVSQVQPFLAQRIFPHTKIISPVSGDLYPKLTPSPIDSSRHRPEEPPEVRLLRVKAQGLADSMRNFIAVQTFEWGTGSADKEPAAVATYEVQVLDGHQQFREYPDGKSRSQDSPPFPPLNTVYVPSSEWSDLPAMVGTEFRLKVHQAADVVVNERRIKVFQYEASVEDDVCGWRSIVDYGIFTTKKDYIVGCYGEVWTDEDTNILRISEHFELAKDWRDYDAVVTYGWFRRQGEPPRLIPLTISTKAERRKKIYWCRGQFTNYRVFSSQVNFLSSAPISDHF